MFLCHNLMAFMVFSKLVCGEHHESRSFCSYPKKIRGDNSDLTDLFISVSMVSVKSSVLESFAEL